MRALMLMALLAACDEEPHDDGEPLDAGAHDFTLPRDALPMVSGPMRLSESGLYSDLASGTLAPGVMRFEVRYPLWSDGAEKQRYLLLPPGTTIDTSDLDHWVFPVGTKAWKEFRSGGTRVETRLLHKVQSDGWWMMSYLWNLDGSDAEAVLDGRDDARGTTHRVPSQEECFGCHLMVEDTLIGVSALQLAGGLLTELAATGRLSAPPALEPVVPGAGVAQDALGYLHGNCGHCHNDGNFLSSKLRLRFWQPVGIALLEESPAYRTAINAKMHHNIDGTVRGVVPGKPAESQLWVRMGLRDFNAMPPVCTKQVDTVGRQTVGDWIGSLP